MANLRDALSRHERNPVPVAEVDLPAFLETPEGLKPLETCTVAEIHDEVHSLVQQSQNLANQAQALMHYCRHP